MRERQLDELFVVHGGPVQPSTEFADELWTRLEAEMRGLDVSGLPAVADDESGTGHGITVLPFPEEPETPAMTRNLPLVAAAALVVVVGLFFALRSGDDNSAPVFTDQPEDTTGQEGTPSTPSVVDPPGHLWSRVPHDEEIFGGAKTQSMSSVTAGGPGFVAVGSEWPRGFDEANAAVWTSPDGFSWSRLPHDEAIFGGDSWAEMLGVTAGGPGLVAVGSNLYEAIDDIDAAVWTSVDGVSWLRVPHDAAVFGGSGEQQMTDVVAGGPGLVAVGWDGDQYGGTAVAAVWTSVDGISWSRVPHDEAVFGGARNQTISSVTAGGPGLVAVGSDGDLHGPGSGDSPAEILAAAVWTSVDGISWSRVPHDEAVFGGAARQWMRGVTAGGPGLVAVGLSIGPDNAIDGGARVWTSMDGLTWSLVPHDGAIFGDAGMTSVTATSRGLVAIGDADLPVVWTSPDGFSWSRVPHDEAVFGGPGSYQNRNNLNRVITTESGVLAVGQTPGAAAVWVATPEN